VELTISETLHGDDQRAPGRVTEVVLKPRYEAANVRLRIGVRGITSLAEEAVVNWFRVRGFTPTVLYETYGLEFSIIDCSSLLFGVVTVDDEIVASAEPVGPRYFNVKLSVRRGETQAVALRTRVTVVMVRRPGWSAELPEELLGMAIDEIDRIRTAVDSHDPEFEARDLDSRITNDALGWYRSWRVPMANCHYSGRMQYSGFIRVLDELAELFLEDKGLPVGELLDTRGWTMVMPRVRVRVLADAYAGDLMHTTYEVHQVVGQKLFDCRFDAHVQRDDRRIPVATGILLQGFASLDDMSGKAVDIGPDIIEKMTSTAVPVPSLGSP
jgi:acyl-CoA thioesterase FadM